MKNFFTLLFFLTFFQSTSFTQNIQLSFYGGINQLTINELATQISFESNSYRPISDRLQEVERVNISYNINSIRNPKLGFEFGGSLQIPIGNRLTIRTGLGLSFSSFDLDYSTTDYTTTSLGVIDTIETPFFPSSFNCDRFLNNYDSDEADFIPLLSMLQLMIPLELGYELVPNRLNIRGGIFLQTPLLTNYEVDRIEFSINDIDGISTCINDLEKQKDQSGNNLNDLQYGFSVNLGYMLVPNIALEVGLRQELSSRFAASSFGIPTVFEGAMRPLVTSVGLRYIL